MERKAFLAAVSAFEPAQWDAIPDLGLYMDQVVTYVLGVLEPLYGEDEKDLLTSSMVNNYVKQELLPRPRGKKYYREHLATLLMITELKRTMSMDEIKKLFVIMGEDKRACYESFVTHQRTLLAAAAAATDKSGAHDVLEKAISVALHRLECQAMLGQQYEQYCAAQNNKVQSQKRRKKEKQDD
jgi:hypothetical protein